MSKIGVSDTPLIEFQAVINYLYSALSMLLLIFKMILGNSGLSLQDRVKLQLALAKEYGVNREQVRELIRQ